MAIQLLTALSPARIIAIDVDEAKLALAARIGADVTVMSGDDAAEEIRGHTGGTGCDVVVDCVGAQPTVELAAAVSRTLGDITLVGLAGGTLGVNFFSVPQEASIATSYWGSINELSEVIALAARGLLDVHIERFSLDDAVEAYRSLERGEITGRAVVLPS